MFGSQSATPQPSTGLFGSKPGGLFGTTTPQQPATSQPSTGLFGSTPSSTAGSLFSTPKSSTTGTSLFGAKPATTGGLFGSQPATSQPSTGLFGTAQPSAATSQPSTGLFGTAQPSAATSQPSTGLFGTAQPSAATSQSSTGTSLFGSKPATSGSLFGTQPATSQPSTGLFGSTQPSTGGGLFSGTKPGGLFGSTTQPQQLQPPPQTLLNDFVLETLAIRTSISEPKIYGDDSDATILRLNQLLAACGTGNGYYNKEKPVKYEPSNPFFQFRGIGYCALSRHKNSDGIVAVILSQSADTYSSPQERQKLLDAIYVVLGSNPDVRPHLVQTRPVTEGSCEVEIYVSKVGTGKINSQELYAFLEQPDKKKLMKDKIPQYDKLVPRVEMSENDIKQYLASAPKGFPEGDWRQAILNNPDPQNLLPYPIYGYKELDDRRQRQLKEREVQRKTLTQLNDRLKTAAQDIQQINGYKKVYLEDAQRLRHRVLRVLAAMHNDCHQQPVSAEEEQLLSRLETILVCLNAPNRLHNRIEKLHDYLQSNKEEIESRKKEAADHQFLSEEESGALKRYLSRRQQDLDIICESINNDADDIKLMLKEDL